MNNWDGTSTNATRKTDIIYFHWDNAEYFMILKPYHGMRIYLIDGKKNFRESYFFPMYGASYGELGDFDLDSDMDLLLDSFTFSPTPTPTEPKRA